MHLPRTIADGNTGKGEIRRKALKNGDELSNRNRRFPLLSSSHFSALFSYLLARLFCCYHLSGPRMSGAIIYELASTGKGCAMDLDGEAQFALAQTGAGNTPSRSIRRRLRALCSLVVAKTGLALYDLSEERTPRL